MFESIKISGSARRRRRKKKSFFQKSTKKYEMKKKKLLFLKSAWEFLRWGETKTPNHFKGSFGFPWKELSTSSKLELLSSKFWVASKIKENSFNPFSPSSFFLK